MRGWRFQFFRLRGFAHGLRRLHVRHMPHHRSTASSVTFSCRLFLYGSFLRRLFTAIYTSASFPFSSPVLPRSNCFRHHSRKHRPGRSLGCFAEPGNFRLLLVIFPFVSAPHWYGVCVFFVAALRSIPSFMVSTSPRVLPCVRHQIALFFLDLSCLITLFWFFPLNFLFSRYLMTAFSLCMSVLLEFSFSDFPLFRAEECSSNCFLLHVSRTWRSTPLF